MIFIFLFEAANHDPKFLCDVEKRRVQKRSEDIEQIVCIISLGAFGHNIKFI
jgi:hypothetical protein